MKLKCLHPTTAYICGTIVSQDGIPSPRMVFDYMTALEYWKTPSGVESHTVIVPCGRCALCTIKKRKEMTCRIANEASMYAECCFITLTYAPEFLPLTDGICPRGTLRKTDLQGFLKRLRRQLDYHFQRRIRFFACGEYGSKTKRPHYHAVIFGWIPMDLHPLGRDSFTSDLIGKEWHFGFHVVQPFSPGHANYISGYVTKKLNDTSLPDGCAPTFFTSSNRGGGIGASWFREFGNDSVKRGVVNVKTKDSVIHFAVPKYYHKLQRRFFPDDFQVCRDQRRQYLKDHPSVPVDNPEEILLQYFRDAEFASYRIRQQHESDKL